MSRFTITSIFYPKLNKNVDATNFLELPEQEIFELRRKLRPVCAEETLLCATCFQPLLLAGTLSQTHFFRHWKDSEDCPIKTTCNLSKEEIERMKYNGQKEGWLHKENKQHIAQLLRSSKNFANVRVEKTFREENPTGIAKSWRRPDVMATLLKSDVEVAFELQVSTTFIDVIIEREAFYRQNRAAILWVFLTFENKRFTELDIFFANKMNAFVFDEEAKATSEQHKELWLTCYYQSYELVNEDGSYYVKPMIAVEQVNVAQLSLDVGTGKLFYLDPATIKESAETQLKEKKSELARQVAMTKHRYHYKTSIAGKGLNERLHDELVKMGKYENLTCQNCGNGEIFRNNGPFIRCVNCDANVHY